MYCLFQYLQGDSKDPNLDDLADFKRMDQAMDAVGITTNTKLDIYRIIAAVLHLGNVNFEENTKDKKGMLFPHILCNLNNQ